MARFSPRARKACAAAGGIVVRAFGVFGITKILSYMSFWSTLFNLTARQPPAYAADCQAASAGSLRGARISNKDFIKLPCLVIFILVSIIPWLRHRIAFLPPNAVGPVASYRPDLAHEITDE